jgi:hypothetical protein
MTIERRTIKTTLVAYRVGAGTFALFTLHKAVHHRCLLTALTGRHCVIRHRVQGSIVTMSWTIIGGAS